MKRLIVNADDYDYTAGVSAGIRRAHPEGSRFLPRRKSLLEIGNSDCLTP
jgi:hypothetical protein